MDLNPQRQVVGATLRSGDSLLQISAFAAPRAAGAAAEPTDPSTEREGKHR